MDKLIKELDENMEEDYEIGILKVTIKESNLRGVLLGTTKGLPIGFELNKGQMSDETYENLVKHFQPVAEKIVVEYIRALSEAMIRHHYEEAMTSVEGDHLN